MAGTQQGVKAPGRKERQTYTEEQIAEFLDVFGDLFEPASLARAPLGRSLGRFAGIVGRPLGEVLYAITGKDHDALVAGLTTKVSVTFESVDIADLHVIAGAIDNDAELLCTNDTRTLSYDSVGSMSIVTVSELAEELGLLDTSVPATEVT